MRGLRGLWIAGVWMLACSTNESAETTPTDGTGDPGAGNADGSVLADGATDPDGGRAGSDGGGSLDGGSRDGASGGDGQTPFVPVPITVPTTTRSFYVAASARDPSDSCSVDNGQGTLANPWGSLYYAASKLLPGDTLFIRGGVYRERFSEFSSECVGANTGAHTLIRVQGMAGTANNPIVIRPYQNENVVIDTTPVGYESWTRCESASQCGACSGLSIPNFANMYYRSINLGSGPRAQIYVDPGLVTQGAASPGARLGYNGAGIKANGDLGIACSDINKLVPGSFTTTGGSSNQTTVYLSDGSNPAQHRIVCSSEIGGCATHAVYVANSSHVWISGAGDDGQLHMQILGGYYTVYATDSQNVTFDRFYVHNSGTAEYGNAVRTGSAVTNMMVNALHIEDVGAEGIALYAGSNVACATGNDLITVQNCRVLRTGQHIYGMTGVSQNLGDGIFGKGTNRASILNNYVEDTQRDGITISPSGSCQANNWVVRGNEVVNACNNPRDAECAGIGAKQHAIDGTSTSTGHLIENNLVHDVTGRPGFTGVIGIRQTGWDNRFGNNTIRYNTIDHTGATGAAISFDGSGTTQASVLVGNLLITNSSTAAVLAVNGNNPLSAHSHNTYWPSTANALAYKSAGTTHARAAVSAFEATAVQSAPLFSSAFHLAANAPQVNAGDTSCGGLSVYRVTRPVGVCDVGADEYKP